jgi:hypothetical protein
MMTSVSLRNGFRLNQTALSLHNSATQRRTSGAKSNTKTNAMGQAIKKPLSQRNKNAAFRPALMAVNKPDIINAIKHDIIAAKHTGA